MMEPTFYEDSRYRGGTRDAAHQGLKRPMTLDLNSASVRSSKKPRLGNSLLTSPDLHLLKLDTPELEKLILQQHTMAPVGGAGQCMYPKVDDRDPYPREFPDALGGLQPPASNYGLYQQQQPQNLQSDIGNCLPPPMVDASPYGGGYHPHPHHHQQQQQPLSAINGNNNPMVSSTTSTNNYVHHQQQQQQPVAVVSNGYYSMEPLVTIKEEPQTVPCASPPGGRPPGSPIDMEDQEKLKLERKRLRNRIAASKCRRRKLERIARLEDKVALLKSENAELQNHVTRLKEHVCHLKQQVLDHVRSGCDILITHPSYNEEL